MSNLDTASMNKSLKPIVGSSSKHLSRPEENYNEDSYAITHDKGGEGDYTLVNGVKMRDTPPPGTENSRPTSRQRGLNMKNVRASLSKTQSQLVELFCRGNSSKNNSVRKLNANKKRSELDTIIASSSSSSGEPQLLSAQKKPSLSMIRSSDHQQTQRDCFLETLEGSPLPNRNSTGFGIRNGNCECSPGNQLKTPEGPTSLRLPCKCGANFIAQVEASQFPSEEKTKEEIEKLQVENRQLWEDNSILAATLEDLQPKMTELQERNKYLEMTMHKECSVLTGIIKECHEEIARLKETQCELLSGENQHDCKKNIREYYISKYLNED